MIKRIRKFVTPNVKERLLESLLFRIYSRITLNRNEVRFSCELTTKCNLRCNMCTRSILTPQWAFYNDEIDKEIVECIINEIMQFHKHGKSVTFTPMGLGEPLLYKELFNLFKKIKNISKKVRIVLVTNGILLDKACAKELISLEVDEVSVSLNAVNRESYKYHMGLNRYDIVCSNIEQLIKVRNKSGKILPSVFVQYLDFDNNKEIFQENIKKWLNLMKYGDKCYIHPILNQAGFYPSGNHFKDHDENYPCMAPFFSFGIKINGDIYPCDPAFYAGPEKIQSLYLGNIMTKSPFALFMDINSKRYKMIEYMKKGDYSQIPECEKCNVPKLSSNYFFELPKILRFKGNKWL